MDLIIGGTGFIVSALPRTLLAKTISKHHTKEKAMEYGALFRLDGKIALVVGGYGGIGTELCHGLSYHGANVVVVGRDGMKAQKIAQDIKTSGKDALGIQCDVTKADEVRQMVREAVLHFGRIDILINCQGAQVDTPAENFKEEDFDYVLDVNLKSLFLVSQAVGKIMITQKKGKILNFSSVRSLLGIRSGYIAYCSSKGAVNMLTKQLASEWAKYNINVNAIAPTFFRAGQAVAYLKNKQFYETLVNRIPLGRVGETVDLVGATIFLSSAASDFITGQILFVDGGVTACQ
jgi:gluconate 5-dehydrogenase